MDGISVITHYVTPKGVRLADDVVGKDFGKELNIRGYVLKDTRLSKDGREKFYVYDKGDNKTGTDAKANSKAATIDKNGNAVLPDTGEAGGADLAIAGGLLAAAGAAVFFWRKKKTDSVTEESDTTEDDADTDQEQVDSSEEE